MAKPNPNKVYTDSLSKKVLVALESPDQTEKTAIARCSGIWSCLRYQYFDYAGETKTEKTGHLKMTLAIGTIIHEGIQSRLVEAGLIGSLEKSIDIRHPQNPDLVLLSGHMDGITNPIKFKDNEAFIDPDGDEYILEIKTMRDRPSTTITEGMNTRKLMVGESVVVNGKVEKLLDDYGVSMMTKPKKSHIAQASLYAHALGINKILFMYLSTNMDPEVYNAVNTRYPHRNIDVPYQLFVIDKDEELVQLSIERAILLKNYLDLGEAPPKEFYHATDGFPQCGNCAFRHLCYPSS